VRHQPREQILAAEEAQGAGWLTPSAGAVENPIEMPSLTQVVADEAIKRWL
jgi:hypothetical protein